MYSVVDENPRRQSLGQEMTLDYPDIANTNQSHGITLFDRGDSLGPARSSDSHSPKVLTGDSKSGAELSWGCEAAFSDVFLATSWSYQGPVGMEAGNGGEILSLWLSYSSTHGGHDDR